MVRETDVTWCLVGSDGEPARLADGSFVTRGSRGSFKGPAGSPARSGGPPRRVKQLTQCGDEFLVNSC